MLKTVQSSMALSTLLFYASQQVGTTYGEFNSFKEDLTGIQACEIFPEKIESLLTDLNNSLQQASDYKRSLQSDSVTYATYEETWSAWAPRNHTVTSSTYGEDEPADSAGSDLETAAGDISGQIDKLSDQLKNLQLIYDSNRIAWDHLSEEMAASSAIALDLLQHIQLSQPNCVEIKQASLLSSIGNRLNQSQFLSDSLRDSLNSILVFLQKIYDTGLELDRLPYQSSNRIEGIYIFEGYAASGDPVSQELLSYYNGLQQSLSSSITNLSSDILKLEGLRETLLEAAEAQRLAEEERMKQFELEQAKRLEQEQQELQELQELQEQQEQELSQAPEEQQPEQPAGIESGNAGTPPDEESPSETKDGSGPFAAPEDTDSNQTDTGVDANDL